MGALTVIEILKEIKLITDQREVLWNQNLTIMIDVFMRRERHIYLKSLQNSEERPSLRDFGPQTEEDLMN